MGEEEGDTEARGRKGEEEGDEEACGRMGEEFEVDIRNGRC